ncbi:MAG TPA: tetratricopeptide repeat protein, partial [Pirellulales bacterium]|nr:tetratricopeptide repeat protein [Pirellulales bacterium]
GQLDHGDEDSALASFTEWTVLEPERPGPWLARGFAYWQLGQFDNALADFNTAVKLAGPMLTNSLAARGGLLHAMQRSKEAMSDFGEALKLNKADGMIYLFRGRSLCAEDKYQAGLKDFKTAVQLNAKDAEAHRNLALVLAACPQSRFRNGKRAVQSATDACELTEWNSWTALDTLAAACAEAGDFAEACRWIQKAADMTDGANRKQCLARLKQYQAHQPLRLDWNSLYGSPSAAADAPISK